MFLISEVLYVCCYSLFVLISRKPLTKRQAAQASSNIFYFGCLTYHIRVICLCPQREDEVALHEWSMWTDAEDLQWVCETSGVQWGVPVHESASAPEHRWATSEAVDAWSICMVQMCSFGVKMSLTNQHHFTGDHNKTFLCFLWFLSTEGWFEEPVSIRWAANVLH